MSDLHARERHDPEWGGPVVDLVEDDRIVGIVYEEDGVVYAELHPDDDGNPWVFDTADLQRVLDTAAAMLGADEDAQGTLDGSGPHPVDILAMEFDALAAHRGPEDEGFYPLPVAARMLARCGDLGLAVVYLEGIQVSGGSTSSVPGHRADLGETNEGQPWALFRAECNTQARSLLERWPRRPEFAVAMEVQDATGERFVL
jgi:hypothetical protein